MQDGKPLTDYLDRLARFVAATPFEAIPQPVIARTKAIIADTVPVIAAGMQAPELVRLAARELAPGRAQIIGAGRTANPIDAAMLNGIAGAWHDFDEGNFEANGHPGIQVIPAALAVAQTLARSGRELLAAIALGYELTARIGAATKMKLIINPHGTYGVVGAALTVARLQGLAAAQFRDLASLAASTCMATNRHTMLSGATVRNWYAGHSGVMGQMAVRLAEAGFSGPADGVQTTFGLVLGDGFDPSVAIAGLGDDWLLERGYLKLYPTARYVHSAIDALADALAGRHLAPEAIRRVEVRAYRLAAYLREQRVANWFGARFSVPFALATIIRGGRSGLAMFDDEAVGDPIIQALAARIDVIEDEAFTARYPREQPVAVRIHLADGATLEGACRITSGEPGNPHPPGAVEHKFFELAQGVFGRARAALLHDTIMRLETVADTAELFS